ncbi:MULTISPECIES: hypothetical protein [unclassified Streptomyces]|uniref:hypothetical protein n=1 Tax=unclassified Streptomyces TaxID=2593676 RepID=UPI00277E7B3C|nr:hypothetical protein [Streptomyces sp. B4I13]MDQ0957050.1 hypothetical protein [Streptomyces sp. B4I13]
MSRRLLFVLGSHRSDGDTESLARRAAGDPSRVAEPLVSSAQDAPPARFPGGFPRPECDTESAA